MIFRSQLKTIFALLALTFVFANESKSQAWEPTYGTEFNFGHPEMEKARLALMKRAQKNSKHGKTLDPVWEKPGETEQKFLKAFAAEVKILCGEDCTVTPRWGKWGNDSEYRVQFTGGYKFTIGMDPMYLEIQTEPETLNQVKENEETVQKYIFSVAEKMKLTSEDNAHLNVGINSAFKDDPEGFLRFFTNYHNNAELASGALGEDFANAPPLSHLTDAQRDEFKKIVSDVNEKKITDLRTLVQRIQNRVYTSTPTFEAGYHYQGISLKRVQMISHFGDMPFEFRAPRQPKTAAERTLLIEMMEKRMFFDQSQKGPVVFLDLPANMKYSDKQLANRFRAYLGEMNADWDHFKPLLPANLQKIKPDAFISGVIDWTKPNDLKELLAHVPYVASSQWTRDKFFTYLSEPEAKNSVQGIKLIEALKKIPQWDAFESPRLPAVPTICSPFEILLTKLIP